MRQSSLALTSLRDVWVPTAPPDLSAFDTIVLDVESTGLHWQRGDRPIGAAYYTANGGGYLPFAHASENLDRETVLRWMRKELRGKRIVGQNLKFDLHMFRVLGVDLLEQGNVFRDTSHMAALLDDHRMKFSLDALAEEWLGERKLTVGPKDNLAALPAGDVAAYAMRDAELTWRLHERLLPEVIAQGLQRVLALEDACIEPTVEMEKNGVHIDEALLAEYRADNRRNIEDIARELAVEVGFQVNPDSSVHWARLFKRYDVPHTGFVTPHGKQSFTAAALKGITHPVIQRVYRLGKLMDLQSKFLDAYPQHIVNGRIHCSLNQLRSDAGGTVSGRYSSSQPNMQQVMAADKQKQLYPDVPFIIRKLFVPPPGDEWVSSDQSQVEFRLAAAYCRAPRLLRAYKQNPETDFHNEVIEMVKKYRPDITRTEAKVSSFLRLYGGGVKKLADTLGVSVDSAEALAQQYDLAFPELKGFLHRASSKAETRGYITTILGRRARFKDRFYSAANRAIQGSAADIFKLALVAVYQARERLGFTMRIPVHDEICGSQKKGADSSGLLGLLNEQRVPLSVKILWGLKTGTTWAACK